MATQLNEPTGGAMVLNSYPGGQAGQAEAIKSQIAQKQQQVAQAKSLGISASQPLNISGAGNVLPVSTTTISNANKNDLVSKDIQTLNTMAADRGITGGQDGVLRYANGDIVPSSPYDQYTNYLNSGGTANMTDWEAGGRPAGQTETGVITGYTGDTSKQDQQIQDLLDTMKARTDSRTASAIENIKTNYGLLKQQAQQIGESQLAGLKTGLLAGRTAQFASASYQSSLNSQINFNAQQMSKLVGEENSLILQAQQAQDDNDFKLMNEKISEIKDTKKRILDQADAINKIIQEQQTKMQEVQIQSDNESEIVDIYNSGTTDVANIASELKNRGVNMTIEEIADVVKNISPDSAQIQTLAKTIAEKGATQDVIQKVLASKNYNEALINAGDALSQMNPTEKLDYQLKQADLANKQQQLKTAQKQYDLLGRVDPVEQEKIDNAEKIKMATTKGQIEVLMDKRDSIDKILSPEKSNALAGRVGVGLLSRKPQTQWWNPLSWPVDIVDQTQGGASFAGDVKQLTAQEFLDKLIDVKNQGATFGALSDNEGIALKNAATKINNWEIKDDKGNGIGIWNVDEKSFKEELLRIKELANKAILRSQGTLLNSEDQSLLDNVFETSNASSFYGE